MADQLQAVEEHEVVSNVTSLAAAGVPSLGFVESGVPLGISATSILSPDCTARIPPPCGTVPETFNLSISPPFIHGNTKSLETMGDGTHSAYSVTSSVGVYELPNA